MATCQDAMFVLVEADQSICEPLSRFERMEKGSAALLIC